MKINNLFFSSFNFGIFNKYHLKINSFLSVFNLLSSLKVILVFFAVILFFNNSFSQENKEKLAALSTRKINRDLLPSFFDEVHYGSSYKYDSEYERIYLEQLSRIELIYSPYVENNYMLKLSSLSKMNKYNPNLDFNTSEFIPEKFNFIKYGFNFYASSDQFIRVDNQDYIIHILPYINKSSK